MNYYPMKTTTVKESKKTSGWLLAIPHEDEKGFEALAYLRKEGYFNTPLYRLNKNKTQKQITRYYLKYPTEYGNYKLMPSEARKTIRQLEERLKKSEHNCTVNSHNFDDAFEDYEVMVRENARLKQRIEQLEAEKAELRTECMEEDGLYDNEDVERILKSSKYGSWVKTANADEHPKLHTPNLNFVAPDMSATLGMGPHVLIDIEKVPKDLQVLLAKMMDALNNHTLRLTQLENC